MPRQIAEDVRQKWLLDVAGRRSQALDEYRQMVDQLSDAIDAALSFGITLDELSALGDINRSTLERLASRPLY
jgi:L-2-hydroxyglutarate oxidase LhgO